MLQNPKRHKSDNCQNEPGSCKNESNKCQKQTRIPQSTKPNKVQSTESNKVQRSQSTNQSKVQRSHSTNPYKPQRSQSTNCKKVQRSQSTKDGLQTPQSTNIMLPPHAPYSKSSKTQNIMLPGDHNS